MSLADARAFDDALRQVAVKRPPRHKPAPAPADVQRRMREVIVKLLTMNASVTERDLEQAGFSRAEVADHFTAACRAVNAHRLAA